MTIKDVVRQVVREELGLSPDHPVKDDVGIYSLGADSLDAVQILIQLEKQFCLQDLAFEKLNLGTIDEIASLVETSL